MKIIVTGDEAPAKNLYQTATRYLHYKDVKLLSVDDFEALLQVTTNLAQVDAYWITGRQRKRLTSLITHADTALLNKVNACLPKILLLTLHGINESHGLGVHVSRLAEFLGYPHSHLLNICCHKEAYANAIPNIEVRPWEVSSPAFESKMELVRKWADESEMYLWSFAVEKEDSDLLRAVSNHFLGRISQKRQHFYDWLPSTGVGTEATFIGNLDAFGGELSSYSDALSKKVESSLGVPCRTYTDSLFYPLQIDRHYNVPPTSSRELRIVLIGNIWGRKTQDGISWYEALDKVLYDQVKDDERISVTWYADPFRVQRTLEAADFYRAKCLIWRGFHPNLRDELKRFDLGVIPHSPEKEMVSTYTHFSIPSRLLDYASAGLPTLAITPKGSGLQEKVISEKLGYSLTFDELKQAPMWIKNLLEEKKKLNAQRIKILEYVENQRQVTNTFAEAMLAQFAGKGA